MDYNIQSPRKFFSFAAVASAIFVSFVFFSCAQNSADIRQAEMTVVFEYSDAENFPTARLCAFVESDSDSRRSGMIEVSSLKDGFTWNADSLVRVKSGERFWTGYTNFLMQKDGQFPLDSYRILIQNADEKEAEETLDFSYDSSFYALKADEAAEKMLGLGAVKKIAIYDESGFLLYYGNFGENLSSARKIWSAYSAAYCFFIIWQTKDNSVICILPEQLVVPDENE